MSQQNHRKGTGTGSKSGLTVARVKEALQQTGGMKTLAARLLQVHRATLYRFLDDHPSLQEHVAEVKEALLDLAETKLIQAIRDGDGQMIRFYLETQGKHRGYTRRVETTGKDGGPVETVTASERNQVLKNIPTDQLRALAEAARKAREMQEAGHAVN